MQYDYDGLKRHYVRVHKMSENDAEVKIRQEICAYLASKEQEYTMMDAYDRRHNLGAYSY